MSDNPVGRPLKFKTPEELDLKIQEYFDKCDKDKRPYTMSGLALALDTSRQTLIDYSERDQFVDSIKKAKGKCEAFAEEGLFRNTQVAGIIFNLKNNYSNWKDRQEIGVENIPVEINPEDAKL